MSEDKCYHYSASRTEDGKFYCFKCKEFVTRSVQWRGTIEVGLFQTRFDQVSETLDWVDLIQRYTGHTINLVNVVAGVEDDTYFSDIYFVHYSVKGDKNIAKLTVRRENNYTGTGKFYVEEEEPETVNA